VSRLDVIAGPNGAGKTTLYERVIRPVRPGLPFVNADRIAHHRFPGEEQARAHGAARIAARTLLWPLIVEAMPHCYRTVFWDNARDAGPFEVGSHRFGVADYPPRWPSWTPQPLLERRRNRRLHAVRASSVGERRRPAPRVCGAAAVQERELPLTSA
jgi:predicted ABC-type ATPase